MNYKEWEEQLNYLKQERSKISQMISNLYNTIEFLNKCELAYTIEIDKLSTKRFDIKTGEEIEEE